MNAWMHLAGWVLIHFIWQGALLAIAAAVVLRLCRSQSSSMRYAIACGALATMLFGVIVTAALIEAPAAGAESPRVSLRTKNDGRIDVLLPIEIHAAALPANASYYHRIEALLPLIVAGWLLGVTLLLARAGAGWWRVRRLHKRGLGSRRSTWQAAADRIASRLGLSRVIRIVELPDIDVPLVVGCLRPIVVLPIAAISQLNAAQVEAILAHELAHVRRHDYLVNLMQTVAETLLFYHPGVWWLSRRIRDEREHCCDDVAVETCGDPIGYAAALAELEGWRSGELSLATAATDGSLLSRVSRVLSVEISEQSRTSSWMIALVVAAVVVGALANLSVAAQTSSTMSDDVSKLEFEVASIKPNKSGSEDSSLRLQPGGRITANNVPLRALIRNAYNLQDFQLVGGPDWLAVDRFDIEAKAEQDFQAQADGPPRELVAMMINLLAERFKLVVHRATQEMPVFALLRREDGKLGPQLGRSDVDCAALARAKMKPPPPPAPTQADPRPVGACSARRSTGRIVIRAGTMVQLAAALSGPANRIVVDRTGLAGSFDVDLQWAPDQTADTYGPSLFTALQEQLGLKLDSQRGPVEVLVIDHVERPTPD